MILIHSIEAWRQDSKKLNANHNVESPQCDSIVVLSPPNYVGATKFKRLASKVNARDGFESDSMRVLELWFAMIKKRVFNL